MNIDLSLSPIDRDDLPKLRRWRNDWRIIAWTRQFDMLNEVEHVNWFERMSVDHTMRMYKIVMKAAGETVPVGVCGLTSIDWRCRRAEFSLLVGPEWQKRGIGKMALSILLTHGFENLGLNLIFGETFEGNPGIKMYEALGFQKEGTRRQHYFKDGRFIDAHLYSITAREWHDLRNRQSGAGDSAPGASAVGPAPEAPADVIDVKPSPLFGAESDGAEAVPDPAKAYRQQRRGTRAKGKSADALGGE